jgi:membrane protein DedA with SNARE-associated domain
MENKILTNLLPHLNHWGYYILFVMTFLETSAFLGLLVPGESLVGIAGLLASQGLLDIGDVIWIASLGAILGDTVGYFLGKRFGAAFFLRYGRYIFFRKEYLDEAEEFFQKHGGKAVFLGRFVGWLRAFAPVVAGISRMRYPRFLFFNIIGGISWAAGISLLGYFAGSSWEMINRYLGRLGIAAFIGGAVITYAYILSARKRHPVKAKVGWFARRLAAQIPKTWDFMKARFEAGTWYGRNMTAGILLFVLGIFLFREIVGHRLERETILYFDGLIRQLIEGVIGPAAAGLTADLVSRGAIYVTALVSILMPFYLLYKSARWELLAFFVVVGMGEGVLYLLRLFSRSLRHLPRMVTAHIQTRIHDLPSSYSFSAMVVFGFLIYMAGRTMNNAVMRRVLYLLSTLLIILIGIGRLYFKVNFLSVLGGYAAGLAWLAFGIVVVNTIRQMGIDRRNGGIR